VIVSEQQGITDMSIWWLSFVDPDKPVSERFLGACCVKATDADDAVKEAWALGCNPGGEVVAFEIEEELVKERGLELGVLMDIEELNRRGLGRPQ
jgi:hypothetical protein